MNKVSGGGCGTWETFVCVWDFRRVNKLTKEPTFYHSFVEGDVGEVGGAKNLFRVRLGECLSPSQP